MTWRHAAASRAACLALPFLLPAAPAQAAEPAAPEDPHEPAKPGAPPTPGQPPAPAPASDHAKRPLPDYDGRKDGTTAGEVALWIPRILLSPLYLVSEYVVRRPLGALVTAAERANLPSILYDFFAFGPDHKAGIAPIAFVDFGFKPSVGVYLFADDAFARGNDVRIHGSMWTTDWLAAVVTDRARLADDLTLSVNFVAIRRPDLVFYGTGPRSAQGDQTRYRRDLLDANVVLDRKLFRSSRVTATLGVRKSRFGPGSYDEDPTVNEGAASGRFPLPDGYGSGYTEEYHHVLAALDSRRPRPFPGSGFRLEGDVEHGTDPRQDAGFSYVRYGGTAVAFLDMTGQHRVVSVSVSALFADPVGAAPVPFTELVTLGGTERMRGFWPGRLVDRSAAVAGLRYRWPIWGYLDGAMELTAGNVFGAHLAGFEPELLRLSGALGVGTVGAPDSSLEMLVGFGTEPFGLGGRVDSVRVVLGTNRGF